LEASRVIPSLLPSCLFVEASSASLLSIVFFYNIFLFISFWVHVLIGLKQAASPNFLAEIKISFRLKKGIVMAENERGEKMNWKIMGVTE
jgi:hypothetical protein